VVTSSGLNQASLPRGLSFCEAESELMHNRHSIAWPSSHASYLEHALSPLGPFIP
jgi:hypothetical protein